jgi:plasmid stabilization system protein ParE
MANKQVEFHEAASSEFEAAFVWYLERSERAALRFAREVERAVQSIADPPERFRLALAVHAGLCCKASHSLLCIGSFLRQFKS